MAYFLRSEVIAMRYTPQGRAFCPLSSREKPGVKAFSEPCAGPPSLEDPHPNSVQEGAGRPRLS